VGKTTETFEIDAKAAIVSLRSVIKTARAAGRAMVKSANKALQPYAKLAWSLNNLHDAASKFLTKVLQVPQAIGAAALAGEKLQATANAFEKIGGTAADLDKLREATAGLMPDSALQRIANTASSFGIAKQDLDKLLKVAVGAGQLLGESTEKMVDSLATGVARGSALLIDNLGIQVSGITTIQKKFAKSIGKTIEDLTSEEKNRALILEIEAKATKQLAVAEEARNAQIAQTSTSITNFIEGVQKMLSSALKSSGALDKMAEALADVGDMMASSEDVIGDLIGMFIDLGSDLIPVLGAALMSIVPILQAVMPIIKALASVLQALAPLIVLVGKVIGILVTVALMPFTAALTALLAVVSAVTNALGIQSDAIDDAADKMVKMTGVMGKAKKQTMAQALAQKVMAEKTRRATEAMKAQADVAKMPKSLAEAYEAAANAAEELGEESAKFKRIEDDIASVAEGGRELALVMGAATSGFEISQTALVDQIERAGADLETQISILIRMEEQALAAAAQLEGKALTSLKRAGVAVSAEGVADITAETVAKVEAELTRRAAAKDKTKKKRRRERTRATKDAGKELVEAEREAALMLMTEVDRERIELEERFDTLIATIGTKNDSLVRGLVEGRTKALEDLEAEVVQRQLEVIDKIAAEGTTIGDLLVGDFAEELGSMVDAIDKSYTKVEARQQAMQDFLISSAQAVGNSASQMFVQLATNTETFRAQIFNNMGQLFGQLGGAFIAWATAEGNLLAGNPFAAVGAAIALQTIGGLISSISTRKPSAGAGGGGSVARRALDERKNREEVEPQVVIFNYGLSAPDNVARSVAGATTRGRNLRGARPDRRRGRAAA
jgi:hypothetical protein